MSKPPVKLVWLNWAVLIWLLSSTFIPSVRAQKPQYPTYTGHVNDFANVLDAATKQQLETILLNFEKRTGAQIAVVTVPSLQDRPVEEYANELYRAWGIGAKGGENKDKGALLLIAPNERKSRLEVGYGLEGDLPDGLAGEMLRRMRPDFQQKQWSRGVTVGVRTLVDTLAQKWNVSVEGIDQQYAYNPAPTGDDISGTTVVGGVFCIFIAVIIFIALMFFLARRGGGGGGRGRRSGWAVAPMIFNSGGGDFGSGSWGSSSGSDSGGSSWGGFGGGSSGGGGASDSW